MHRLVKLSPRDTHRICSTSQLALRFFGSLETRANELNRAGQARDEGFAIIGNNITRSLSNTLVVVTMLSIPLSLGVWERGVKGEGLSSRTPSISAWSAMAASILCGLPYQLACTIGTHIHLILMESGSGIARVVYVRNASKNRTETFDSRRTSRSCFFLLLEGAVRANLPAPCPGTVSET